MGEEKFWKICLKHFLVMFFSFHLSWEAVFIKGVYSCYIKSWNNIFLWFRKKEQTNEKMSFNLECSAFLKILHLFYLNIILSVQYLLMWNFGC